MLQPFLHDLIACVRAPVMALSGPDGQIRPSGAQGVFRHDYRVLSELAVEVDGTAPAPVGHDPRGADVARFVAVVRHLGDPGADPTVRLERQRRATGDGLIEQITLVNGSRREISATVTVVAAVDFTPMDEVKHGRTAAAVSPEVNGETGTTWNGAHTRTTLSAGEHPERAVDGDRLRLSWPVRLPAHSRWSTTLTLSSGGRGPDSPDRFTPADDEPGRARVVSASGPEALSRLVARGAADLAVLTLADPHRPADTFAAAGVPWYATLFGRDSLWAARFMLPGGTDLARGTLHTLARRQGTRHDRATGEAPGKIPHEVRGPGSGMHGLPPVYFGTVDATSLWICLLYDAWRWGMPAHEVVALLDPLQAALAWLVEHADADGDGLLEYVDHSGRGLTNQGWKDSRDSIQFPDGTLAEPPITLSEAQAYAYQAATHGAILLEAFGRSGAVRARAWAQRLRERFREQFWVEDTRGGFPAIALDARKRPVATASSNMGHLLGTGLLEPAEAAAVARRLAQPDLDCGYGLRTMTSDAVGFNPLGYHTGSIWPHDTAITINGLAREGHTEVAASLADGLLRAAPSFEHRLPELYAGTDARDGEPVLAYPASCRPQAWSAASAVAVLAAALGLDADVPGGRVSVRPHGEFASWFPLHVDGLRLAGHEWHVSVDATGRVRAETTAPVTVDVPAADLVPAPRQPTQAIDVV